MDRYMVVMAGGGGTRFWPLSRADFPKHFLTLAGQDAMINKTITRASSMFSPEKTFIVTAKSQQGAMERILSADVPRENILYEPMPKNTAPCILYAALHIQKKHGDGVMCVLASDHYITNEKAFLQVLDTAISVAEGGPVVTIGITPTFPSTGYGYVKRGEKDATAYVLDKFVEKPDIENAMRYIDTGEYYWNSGMFVWKVSTIIALYKKHLPDMYAAFMAEEASIATPEEARVMAEVYPRLQGVSVDYGIMEHVRDARVVPGDFGWSDIGSWDTLGSVTQPDADGNITKGDFVGIDAANNVVYGTDKLITAVGVENLIIVESGDAILICAKDRAQDVKSLVDQLKANGLTQYL